MLANLNGWHLLVSVAVIMLLFGAAKLPALAKSVGQSARVFKGEMRALKDESEAPAGHMAVGAAASLPADGAPTPKPADRSLERASGI